MKTTTLAPFMESHDQIRFAALTGDMALTRNAIAFTMLMDGIPIIYQGQEQHSSTMYDPQNREPLWTYGYHTDTELYQWIKRMNAIRSHVIATDPSFIPFQADPVWSTNHTMAMKKGALVSVFTNVALGGGKTKTTLLASTTQYIAGKKYVDLVSCESFTAATDGSLTFDMGWESRIFYPASKMDGASICTDGPETRKCKFA